MTKQRVHEQSWFLVLGFAVAVVWAVAVWVGFRMLDEYNAGDMAADDALLTTVAVAVLAVGVSAVFACLTLYLTVVALSGFEGEQADHEDHQQQHGDSEPDHRI